MRVNEVAIMGTRRGWGEAARHLPTQYMVLNTDKWIGVWHMCKAGYSGYQSGGQGSLSMSSVTAFPSACFNLRVMMVVFNAAIMVGASRDMLGRVKVGLGSGLKVKPRELYHRANTLASALISAWVMSAVSWHSSGTVCLKLCSVISGQLQLLLSLLWP